MKSWNNLSRVRPRVSFRPSCLANLEKAPKLKAAIAKSAAALTSSQPIFPIRTRARTLPMKSGPMLQGLLAQQRWVLYSTLSPQTFWVHSLCLMHLPLLAGGASHPRRQGFNSKTDNVDRPGIALYTAFGFMAGFSGWLLYNIFMGRSALICDTSERCTNGSCTQASTRTNSPASRMAISDSASTAMSVDTA